MEMVTALTISLVSNALFLGSFVALCIMDARDSFIRSTDEPRRCEKRAA